MFHVVQIKNFGRHVGYEVWYAVPFGGYPHHWSEERVVPITDGVRLKRHEAYRLAREWNGR